MHNTVIISTVGTGSRLGNLTKNLNKALVPYKGKPVLSHILDKFPKDIETLILVGYRKDQIIDYCKLVHSDRNIKFIDVDDWTSEKSGTAYSLRHAKSHVGNPFWYVACDTYFEEDIFTEKLTENTYFVKQVSENMTSQYCMFELGDDTIKNIQVKKQTPSNWVAFVGLMYIHDHATFFNDLDKIQSIEAVETIKPGEKVKNLDTWLDFGNLECYLSSLAKSQKFDYSKNDEITYIDNDKVIKWWVDSSVPIKKTNKTTLNIDIFPNNVKQVNNWICYDFVDGQTLYQVNDHNIMPKFLDWLENDVWKPIDDPKISLRCKEFYETKSLDRIDKFLKKYPILPSITAINGIPVKSYIHYLTNIDWDLILNDCRSYFIHGDLQFDNVVLSKDNQFKLIDWRQEFAGIVQGGDIYYDYAKLLGGCFINYSQIKEHNFKVEVTGTEVTLHIPHIDNLDKYVEYIKASAQRLNLNFDKIATLVPLIYWNMSPLHGEPFDVLLWYYAMMLFEKHV